MSNLNTHEADRRRRACICSTPALVEHSTQQTFLSKTSYKTLFNPRTHTTEQHIRYISMLETEYNEIIQLCWLL